MSFLIWRMPLSPSFRAIRGRRSTKSRSSRSRHAIRWILPPQNWVHQDNTLRGHRDTWAPPDPTSVGLGQKTSSIVHCRPQCLPCSWPTEWPSNAWCYRPPHQDPGAIAWNRRVACWPTLHKICQYGMPYAKDAHGWYPTQKSCSSFFDSLVCSKRYSVCTPNDIFTVQQGMVRVVQRCTIRMPAWLKCDDHNPHTFCL